MNLMFRIYTSKNLSLQNPGSRFPLYLFF